MEPDQNGVLLARIDERVVQLQADVKRLQETMESRFITREEFQPIRLVVYGLVGIVLLSFIGALATLIIR